MISFSPGAVATIALWKSAPMGLIVAITALSRMFFFSTVDRLIKNVGG